MAYVPKYKICVSGAAETDHCKGSCLEKAKEVGREIVRQGAVLVTGATTGVPYWAATGAKEEGGISIGLSPAVSVREHVKVYQLPIDQFDLIIYTGFDYSGRNLLLTRSSDAALFLCGRMGTLNEFTIAFEDQKPMGVLEGTGGVADMAKEIISQLHKGPGKIIYATNPKDLVHEILEVIEQERVAI